MFPMKPYSIHTTAKDQICSVWMIYLFWNKKKSRKFSGFKATVNKEPCGLHVFAWHQNYIHFSVEALRLHMHPWTKKYIYTTIVFQNNPLGRQCFIQSACFEVRHIHMNMATPNMSYVIRICTRRKPWSLMAWLWNVTWTVLAYRSPWGYTCIQVPKPMGLIALQLQTNVKTHVLTTENCTL